MKHFNNETLSELRKTGIKTIVSHRSGYNKVFDSETYILYPFTSVLRAHTFLIDVLNGTKYEEQLKHMLYNIEDEELDFMALAKDSYAYWLKVMPMPLDYFGDRLPPFRSIVGYAGQTDHLRPKQIDH